MLLDLVTGDQRALASDIGTCECDGGPNPMWSPSGGYLVYVAFRNQPGGAREIAYLLMEVASGEVRYLPGSPYRFGWENDADILAVETEGRFELGERPGESMVLFLDAASDTVVREEHMVHDLVPTNAHRSPDGRWIALVRTGTVMPEGAGEWPVDRWSLSVIDTESGVEVLIGEGQFEFPARGSPGVAWNEGGTHFVFFTSPDL